MSQVVEGGRDGGVVRIEALFGESNELRQERLRVGVAGLMKM